TDRGSSPRSRSSPRARGGLPTGASSETPPAAADAACDACLLLAAAARQDRPRHAARDEDAAADEQDGGEAHERARARALLLQVEALRARVAGAGILHV